MLEEQKVIVKLNNDGFSHIYLSKIFEVSRQRIWQILKKNKNSLIGKKKNSFKINNTPSELFIFEILQKKGFNVVRQGYNNSYDFLVNNKKIEVKYRSKGQFNHGKRTSFFVFGHLDNIEKIDFYIFICDKIPNSKIFIVPSNKVKRDFYISLKPRSKKQKFKLLNYLDNWEALK
jgi:hypothetical protein